MGEHRLHLDDDPFDHPSRRSTPEGEPDMSAPVPSKPVETKVTVATIVALIAAVVLAALNYVGGDAAVLANVDPVLRGLLLALIPPVAAFVGGYVAPHTSR